LQYFSFFFFNNPHRGGLNRRRVGREWREMEKGLIEKREKGCGRFAHRKLTEKGCGTHKMEVKGGLYVPPNKGN
jgi:hypothetical protein